MPHPPPSTSRLDSMPPTPSPHRLRSRPSSSSASVASRRSPVSPRRAVFSPSGMWSSKFEIRSLLARNTRLDSCDQRDKIERGAKADVGISSDGIARVHGLANVQCEELVEYVVPYPMHPLYHDRTLTPMVQVRLWRQGHVHEPRGRPGRRRLVRFRSSCQGGRNCQANR